VFTIHGNDGRGGASLERLPSLIKVLKNVVSLDGDFSIGLLANIPLLGAIVRALEYFFKKEIKLSPNAALVLLSFPAKMERSTFELLNELEKVCNRFNIPAVDEFAVAHELATLESHNVVTKLDALGENWKLNEKFSINPF
jgi:hypothetical protein